MRLASVFCVVSCAVSLLVLLMNCFLLTAGGFAWLAAVSSASFLFVYYTSFYIESADDEWRKCVSSVAVAIFFIICTLLVSMIFVLRGPRTDWQHLSGFLLLAVILFGLYQLYQRMKTAYEELEEGSLV